MSSTQTLRAPAPAAAEPPGRCRNCDAALVGPYCAACGQAAEPRVVPFGRWLSDHLASAFSLDRRSFRTFRALLRPGALTQSYLDGHRVRYTPPLRLYLAAALLYFFVQALAGGEIYFGGVLRVGGEGFDQSRFLTWLNRVAILVPFGWALVLKALYRRELYIAHVVFALHVQAFAFLCWSVSTASLALAPSPSPADPLSWLAALILITFGLLPPIYAFVGLRRLHGEGRLRTLLKGLAAGIGYALVLAVLTALALGLIGVLS